MTPGSERPDAASGLRLGLIGAGRWGRNYIETLENVAGVTLARLASSNPESRRLVAPACAVGGDWREVAEAEDLDGIIIATPPALHAQMTRVALAAGLPVLVEKPLTLDVEEARALLDFARRRDGLVMVDHIHLFSHAYQALKREGRELGPVRHIRAEAGNRGPFRADTPAIWDWGAHDVAMCVDLLGAVPEKVEARCLEKREVEEGSGETFELRLGFDGGTTAEIVIGNLFAGPRRLFSVQFERGRLVYDDTLADKLALVPAAAGSKPRNVSIEAERPLARAVRAFAEAISAGTGGLDGLRLGVEVVEVLAMCQAALEG